MTNLTRIVAAVVDTKKATLYKSDGTTIEILQGDARLRSILEHITPLLATQKYADIDLSVENSWKAFEEKSNGATRFFKIAKNKLKSLFGAKKEEEPAPWQPGVVGEVPSGVTQAAKNMAAVDEIMKHAVPVSSESFDEKGIAPQRPTVESDGKTPNDARKNEGSDAHFDKATETIVAVTPKGKIIPGVERIKSQFAAANKNGNAKGLTLFLERLGKVIEQRKHTADDLLRFMERGDLPIADDGTIIIYKRLQRRDGNTYVDCHSRKVIQKVGSYVHMDISLVDHNRRNECSNGLHVARRGYIRNFSGNVVVLAKVRPEDVIAVPDYDANKMRVCGYHIIAELTDAQFQAITSNRPITDAEGGAELLAKAISGDHIGTTQLVKINGSMGGNLQITEVVTEKGENPADLKDTSETVEKLAEDLSHDVNTPPPPAKVKKVVSKKAKKAKRKVAVKKAVLQHNKKARTLEADVPGKGDAPVSVKDLQKLKDGTSKDLSTEVKGTVTQTDVVKALWDSALTGSNTKAQELLDFKKKAKKSWLVWGLPANAGDTLKALIQTDSPG